MEAVRAYSTLAVKSFAEDQQGFSFSGLATSPVADRVNDRIDPLGAKYRNPVCLLRAHDHLTPIGECNFGRPTKSGITFDARIPKITEPGLLKDRLEMAAGEVRSGLMRGVSIGFRPTKPPTPNELGGLDYPATEIYELSTCAVPMHQLATIDTIKAIDAAVLRGEASSSSLPAGSVWDAVKAAGINALDQTRLEEFAKQSREAAGGKESSHDWISATILMNMDATFEMCRELASEVDRLKASIDEPALAYAGVHQRALAYRRGQAVTYKGNLYIALHATERGDLPGETTSWQLAVKAGRDGKDMTRES